jgi:hypothetical protein
MGKTPTLHVRRALAVLTLALFAAFAATAKAQDAPAPPGADPQAPPQAPPRGAEQPGAGPSPIPEFRLPTLPTIPVRREAPGYNWIVAEAAPLPKDREGIWVLEFAYLPVRVTEVEVKGQRRRIYYLYYRVVNRTGQPRRFVPQFTLITDDGQRLEDVPLPVAVKRIQAHEDPTKPLLGSASIVGEIPPSTREGIDEAVYGVALWDGVDHRADAFQVFVRGLSDGYQVVQPPQGQGGEPFTRYKALRLDFVRFGDERSPHSREIRPGEPPYEWVYYP